MLLNTVKVYPSKVKLPKKKQLAWKIAEIASDNTKLNNDSTDQTFIEIYNRITEGLRLENEEDQSEKDQREKDQRKD